MYPNLNAEMARDNITAEKISEALGVSANTVRNKLTGRTLFNTQEATKIKNAFFPDLTLDYLFAQK